MTDSFGFGSREAAMAMPLVKKAWQAVHAGRRPSEDLLREIHMYRLHGRPALQRICAHVLEAARSAKSLFVTDMIPESGFLGFIPLFDHFAETMPAPANDL